jgi:hypothetical protein
LILLAYRGSREEKNPLPCLSRIFNYRYPFSIGA